MQGRKDFLSFPTRVFALLFLPRDRNLDTKITTSIARHVCRGKERISRVRKIIRPFHKVRQLNNFPFLSNLIFFHCRSEINVGRGIGSERQKKCAGGTQSNSFLHGAKKKLRALFRVALRRERVGCGSVSNPPPFSRPWRRYLLLSPFLAGTHPFQKEGGG